MNERNEKIKILTGTAEVFGFHFSDMSFALYLEALADLSSNDLKRIISYGIKTNAWRFMPRPGEILSLVRMSDEKSTALKAKNEFDMILESVRRNGRQVVPEMSEAAKNSIRQIGGLERIANASDDDLVWIRKDFDAVYEMNDEKYKIDNRKLRLVGKHSDKSKELRSVTKALAEKFKIPD